MVACYLEAAFILAFENQTFELPATVFPTLGLFL